MAKSQYRSLRQVTGRKYVDHRKKRLGDLGRNPALTSIGERRVKSKRGLGGNIKDQLLSDSFVNVTTKGKTVKLKIQSVIKNPADINFTRRNIITKGCLVKTEKGDVKITSRPGQSGILSGVFNK